MQTEFTDEFDFKGETVHFSYFAGVEGLFVKSTRGDFRLPAVGTHPSKDDVIQAIEAYLGEGGLTLSVDEPWSQGAKDAAPKELFGDLEPAPTLNDGNPVKDKPVFGSNPFILLVDDDPNLVDPLKLTLTEEGFDVVTVADVFDAISAINVIDFDVVLSDVRLPRGDGIFLLTFAKEKRPELPVFLMTAYWDLDAEAAQQHGASGLFGKPFSMDALLEAIHAEIGQGHSDGRGPRFSH